MWRGYFNATIVLRDGCAHLRTLAYKDRHEILAGRVVQNDNFDAPFTEKLFIAFKVHVLSNDNSRNAVQQYCAGAHAARAAKPSKYFSHLSMRKCGMGITLA